MRDMGDTVRGGVACAQGSGNPEVLGVDVLDWLVIWGLVVVLSQVARFVWLITRPLFGHRDAVVRHRGAVVVFGDQDRGGKTFTVDIANRGRDQIRVDNAATLSVRDQRDGGMLPIGGYVGPDRNPFSGTLHAGEGFSTLFDRRAVAARLSEMGFTGTQEVYGRYVVNQGRRYRTQTPHRINVDAWAQSAIELGE
jgi:hypothetical protein